MEESGKTARLERIRDIIRETYGGEAVLTDKNGATVQDKGLEVSIEDGALVVRER